MGPCKFCGKMIYLDWMAERGYHRECNEKHIKEQTRLTTIKLKQQRESIKRSARKREKRLEQKRL